MPIFGNSLRGTLGYLPADLIEQLVLRRERDRSLRLDLQQHLTGMRCSVDHQIVKRKALIYALVTNPLDERSGQPARLDIGEERQRSEEHTSELQSLMRTSYAVFCLNKKSESSYTMIRDEWQHTLL